MKIGNFTEVACKIFFCLLPDRFICDVSSTSRLLCEEIYLLFFHSQSHEAKLKVKLSKCFFGRRKVIYLCHKISTDGVRQKPTNSETINKIQPPVDISGLRRFLRLTLHCRRFVEKYAFISEPLNNLLQKGKIYKWDEKCKQGFEELKKSLILVYPNFEKIFSLQTNASDFWLRAVLAQKNDQKRDQAVVYASRLMTKAERNYTVIEKYIIPKNHSRQIKLPKSHV